MRGLLVVNPVATATTERVRDVLASALAADLALETVVTKGRGHGVELGARAAELGVDVVLALGGDGTVNEIINGLLQNGPVPGGPAFAVVPGGSTNVFARALGYSASPVEATGELLSALREGRTRRISLGRAQYGDERRWFTFCFGIGLDARVVARVEEKRGKGRRNTAGLFLRTAAGQILHGTDRRGSPITLTTADAGSAPAPGTTDPAGGRAEEHIAFCIVCNTRPWTYLNSRPVLACPDASFDTGLDLLALRRVRLPSVLRAASRILTDGEGPRGRNVVRRHNTSRIRFSTDTPLPVQMDGEYLGMFSEVLLTHQPHALRVVA
ncbi:diacylglycerol kinase [Frankia sp. CcI156]|uniref:Diacylglycerol kinase, catalytic region n=1 Tax=Frankia casuarinae (strain DSM 45818 / CECT 9043 / HFP020203 / CcI3) TaxID=106370 RepID=Q2J6I4_FRACC|nr:MULTISPECIES: diacylglycerol kinase family protein [Frankia]ABD13108.1 diacylglycerol kinase, catalytic region [Frankia casuarinae]ETA00496.1 sphingosine/diacylglycerol kinase-like enzyme [Frankia sp. CcI6]EYT91268.1 sphingosine/diacylglycerol kinase-like enzyme [Frankia casuarinae]KDA41821.1 sphingosine/diacylglycerol kinase-like enzyme [Frankia sp. BMG5.23]OAA21706.1 sphingosine/diacylglycerol kinase-like enzyme [Frankia casuarinae]